MIPGITAHRAVHVAGPVAGRVVLVQGGAGAVGLCAVALARHAGATVLATVRSDADVAPATAAGAHAVLQTGRTSTEDIAERILAHAPDGVDHVVEVAFDANVAMDEVVLKLGGSIAAYATLAPEPALPFWPLVFKNTRIDFLGSDDFPPEAKQAAATELNATLAAGWSGPRVDVHHPLTEVAAAHLAVEQRRAAGRVVLVLD